VSLRNHYLTKIQTTMTEFRSTPIFGKETGVSC